MLVEAELPPELTKQEMLVQYLQDAYNFSAKITEALSMVSRMMYESSVSGKFSDPEVLLVCHAL